VDGGNLFSNIPSHLPDEVFDDVIAGRDWRVERIVSKGHSTPKDVWLCQDINEWVILLKGSAGILFEGVNELIVLKPGDYITINARRRHRVEWTDDTQETIWLAMHYD
tara:strand:+ start:2754 stop:3077 length:324 start_codon:yes stop_codon:yes gene_type:complete